MVDLPWLDVAMPLFVGVGLSFLLECQLEPRAITPWKRHWASLCIHIGIWFLLFVFELVLFQRPWFAVFNVLALLLLVVQVNNAKYHSLREPFIFQDFEYFIDVLKHPRLYLPFLGVARTLIIAAGFIGALYGGVSFEPSLFEWMSIKDFLILLISLMVFGFGLFWLGANQKLPVTFDAETDLKQLGLLTSLWRYAEEERKDCCFPIKDEFTESAQASDGALPNLVVVQSESFFDARRLFSGIRTEVLQEFDAIKTSAVCHGQVEVPAWGANTVRTEFAFLSGLSAESIGVHRFNPYRKLAKQGILTLASFLKSLGYRTVCVHPYPASFYARDKVFPLLGFDEFIDIQSFNIADKTGPYIGDVALAEKVCGILEASSTQAIFVFVITMENHGPLHLEKVSEGDVDRLYSTTPPEDCEDLTIYLRHLGNADRMAGMLRDRLDDLPGSNWLCWYGDHVPIMPKVYAATSTPSGRTDYLLWAKDKAQGDSAHLDLKVENLSALLLQEMGLIGIEKIEKV